MVSIIRIKKSPYKNISKKIKLCKKNFLGKKYFVIINRLSCERGKSSDPTNHLESMRQLDLLWISEANNQMIRSIVSEKPRKKNRTNSE
jgi:hypothetical protein